jgi:hypothetical protein
MDIGAIANYFEMSALFRLSSPKPWIPSQRGAYRSSICKIDYQAILIDLDILSP